LPPPSPEGAAAGEAGARADPPRQSSALDRIGYRARDVQLIRQLMYGPDGLMLVVGPAGSGRRAALRAMLAELDPAKRPVRTLTARRPHALARLLRNGSDVVLVESIQSGDVAQVAVHAARAGRLVLATMPVGRACAVIAEFQRFHTPAVQLLDALSLVISHRILRRLCAACSIPDDREAVRHALAPALNTWLCGSVVQLRRAAASGCTRCEHTGYDGTVLAYELLDLDLRARALIASGTDTLELEHVLLADGGSIWDRGLKHVADGITSFDALQAAVRRPR
jgi:general secretion pathway protein E